MFPDPDAFYAQHGTNLGTVLGWLFRHVVRHRMNRTVGRLRTAARQPGNGEVSCFPCAVPRDLAAG